MQPALNTLANYRLHESAFSLWGFIAGTFISESEIIMSRPGSLYLHIKITITYRGFGQGGQRQWQSTCIWLPRKL